MSSVLRDFYNGEERSIEFSVDPDMYKKLKMTKPRKGEEKMADIETVYDFQLKRDVAKLINVKGTFEHRNKKYLSVRERDPRYRNISTPSRLAEEGNFQAVSDQLKHESWQQSAKPYGVIAHKRYVEYVHSLPQGPAALETKDQLQREMDSDLIQKLM